MTKDYLELKVRKAVLSIDDKVTDICNVLKDLSMKLSYLIKDKKSYDDIYYGMLKGG